MKTKFAIYSVLLTWLLLLILFNCKKETLKVAPTVTIAEATNVTANSATVSSTITADGGSEVLSRGVCWNITGNPTTSDTKTTDGKGMGSFTSSLTSLSPGTTYNLKSYATNTIGTAYSSQTTFKTLALLATLTTTDASAIASTSVSSGGNITNDGGAEVTARGVCWSTTQNPTIADSKTTDGTGSGSFTSQITGLTPGATYYFKAYATNSIGTAYGNQITITTTAILPVITTTTMSAITATTAISGGNIISDGGATVTARGICWSTTQNPTIADGKTTDGTGSGSFTSQIAGLSPGTTYYFRAYATNSIGTAYGNEVTATATAVLPSITTSSMSSITATTATSGGNITSDGGATVTARGVCWNTSANPTISNSKTTDGTGTGSFISSVSGLIPGATYYLRAYATNSIGTSYGNEFTTISLNNVGQTPNDAKHPFDQVLYASTPPTNPYGTAWFQAITLQNNHIPNNGYISVDSIKLIEEDIITGIETVLYIENYNGSGALSLKEGGLYERFPSWNFEKPFTFMSNSNCSGGFLTIKIGEQPDRINHFWGVRQLCGIGKRHKTEIRLLISGDIAIQAGMDYYTNTETTSTKDCKEAFYSKWYGDSNGQYITIKYPEYGQQTLFDRSDYGFYTNGKFYLSKKLVDFVGGSSVALLCDATGWEPALMTLNGNYYEYNTGKIYDSAQYYCFKINPSGSSFFIPHAVINNLVSPSDEVDNKQGGYNFYTNHSENN